MRRLFGITLLTFALTSVAFAGDVPSVDITSPVPPSAPVGDTDSWSEVAFTTLQTLIALL